MLQITGNKLNKQGEEQENTIHQGCTYSEPEKGTWFHGAIDCFPMASRPLSERSLMPESSLMRLIPIESAAYFHYQRHG